MAEVSIIIPVYNVAPYIRRCLDSVVAQTFQDIECILIDDCATDNSIMIVEEFVNSYQGRISFKIIHHPLNSGLSAARNTGIKESTSTYLYFLDSDDTITPNCIETLFYLFSKYPDINFAQGNILQENGEISRYGFNNTIPEYINNKEDIYKYLLSIITTSAWNRLIRRKFIIENSLYFPVGIVHEDMYWMYFVAKKAAAAAFSNIGTYTYYINKGSILTSISKEKRIERYTSRLKAACIYLEDMLHYYPNKFQRQYLALNLLSCLPELTALHSLSNWLVFWKAVLNMSLKISHRITVYQLSFIALLLPPACFLMGQKRIRWRIQNVIVSKL